MAGPRSFPGQLFELPGLLIEVLGHSIGHVPIVHLFFVLSHGFVSIHFPDWEHSGGSEGLSGATF